MKKILPIIAFILIIIAARFIFDRCNVPDAAVRETVVKCDTVTVCDTILVRDSQPAVVTAAGVSIVTLPAWRPPISEADSALSVDTPDSVAVEIPIEQRHYAGEDYDAWVSGYQPTLDSLNIYRPVTTVKETQTVTRWRTRRWGLSVGAGAALTPRGVEPGIFVGVSYTFYSF